MLQIHNIPQELQGAPAPLSCPSRALLSFSRWLSSLDNQAGASGVSTHESPI